MFAKNFGAAGVVALLGGLTTLALAQQAATTQPAVQLTHGQMGMHASQSMPMQQMRQQHMEQHRALMQSIEQTLDKVERAQQANDPAQIRQALQAAQDQLRQVKQQMAQRMEMMQKMHQAPGQAGQAQGYTCPMHPEVRSDKAGTCPKCGMTLKPFQPNEKTGQTGAASHHVGSLHTDQ